ncbi:MAG: ATP-binding protein, partial [Lachnospiraceae bacterium]
MALTNSQYDSIMRMYNQKQYRNKHRQDVRVEEIDRVIPKISQINAEITSLAVESAKRLLNGDESSKERLRYNLEDLREAKKALLRSKGYPEDYLEMHYDCPDCQDTGYHDGKKCHCFRKAQMELLYDQSNIREAMTEENFQTFSYEYYDDSRVDERLGRTVREYMHQVVRQCKDYIERFDQEKGSLLFTGATGLGKTFLSHCIAKELIDRCYSVVYMSATDLFDLLSANRFSYDPAEEVKDLSSYILDCDLLMIDDLGTELINTFTTSQLYFCINERQNRKQGTIISTNLPVNRLRDEFTDRVAS